MAKTARFLVQLRELLENHEKYGQYINWVHDGKAIQITREKEFAATVLMEMFHYSNFNSFVRQLNIYGFRKTQRKLDERIYYHPRFLRSQPSLAAAIKRKRRREQEPLALAFPIQRGGALAFDQPPNTNLPRLPSLREVLDRLRHN